MQPKVKFNKKGNAIKYNLTSPGFNENEDSKAEDILKTNNDVINMYSTNPNKFNKKKYESNKIKCISTDRKRNSINKKNNEDNEQDFIKGLKSLYLFNQKRRGSKDIDFPSLS